MYLHLGGTTMITSKNLIGIFDIDYCSVDKRTREFLRAAEQGGRIVNVSNDLPKSFIVHRENGKDTVYVSPISPATLRKRVGVIEDRKGIDYLDK